MATLLCDVDMAELVAFCQAEAHEGSPRSAARAQHAVWASSPRSVGSAEMDLAEVRTTVSCVEAALSVLEEARTAGNVCAAMPEEPAETPPAPFVAAKRRSKPHHQASIVRLECKSEPT